MIPSMNSPATKAKIGEPSPKSTAKPSKKSAVVTVAVTTGVSRSTCQSSLRGSSCWKKVVRCIASPHCVRPAPGGTLNTAGLKIGERRVLFTLDAPSKVTSVPVKLRFPCESTVARGRVMEMGMMVFGTRVVFPWLFGSEPTNISGNCCPPEVAVKSKWGMEMIPSDAFPPARIEAVAAARTLLVVTPNWEWPKRARTPRTSSLLGLPTACLSLALKASLSLIGAAA